MRELLARYCGYAPAAAADGAAASSVTSTRLDIASDMGRGGTPGPAEQPRTFCDARRCNTLLATTVLLVATGTVQAATPAHFDLPEPLPNDPDRARIVRLRESVHNIVHGPALGRARVGIAIVGVKDGQELYRLRDNLLLDPASNQKVLASAALLLRLGNGFRYHTEVSGPRPDAQGEIAGDIVLRGSGDPSLSAADLERLAAQIAARGVTRVRGDVLAHPVRLDYDGPEPDAHSPIHLSASSLIVRVRPAWRVGLAPQVTVAPLEGTIRVQNRARTSGVGRSRVGVRVETAGGTLVVVVTGRIAAGHPGAVFRRRPPSSMMYAAMLLKEALLRQGVHVDGQARVGAPSARAGYASGTPTESLALHHSAPLPELLRVINKLSNNDYADRLLARLGAERYGGAATLAKGVEALREELDLLGLPRAHYFSTNGSGLGHGNRISARGMITLLRALYLDPRIGPELLQSLSVGGVDGTTRNRFRASPAAHLVRAKTGTLNGKSTLSGFVGRSEAVAFSILVDRIPRRGLQAVRAAQVRIVEAILAYLEGEEGEAPVEDSEPGLDFEIDEDTLDLDLDEARAAAGDTPGVGG